MTLDEKKNDFKTLFIKLLEIRRKMRGRDDTILTALTYENFEEYYEAQSFFWIMPFSTDEKLFQAVFRNFFRAQLNCILEDKTREEQFKFEDFINEVIEENILALISKLKDKYPKLEQAIKDTNARNRGVFPSTTTQPVNDEFSGLEVA
ncbi:hypothetical protein [Burkholderia vietnamiensis]|uniref:hypothetical protein n=1 Tax=Burkholderia vietnamiensis TaxID=60552 RepID=UPI0012DB7000|nr:hypothetical protein [Burkholderia vietnamiensis]